MSNSKKVLSCTYMKTRVIGELAIVAQSDVFLFPVFVESLVRSFIKIALFNRNGSAAAQLTAIAVFGFLLFVLLTLFVFFFG